MKYLLTLILSTFFIFSINSAANASPTKTSDPTIYHMNVSAFHECVDIYRYYASTGGTHSAIAGDHYCDNIEYPACEAGDAEIGEKIVETDTPTKTIYPLSAANWGDIKSDAVSTFIEITLTTVCVDL
jgi:hypothetical protein